MEKPIMLRAPAARFLPALLFLVWLPAWAAGPFNVNTKSDTHAVNPSVSPNDTNGNISLRSAIEAANAQPGPTTINLPSTIFELTLGELEVAPNGTNTITISGTAAAGTIVNQTDGTNRVFNIDANSAGGAVVTLSGITISGGTDQRDGLGGAGILAGSLGNSPLDSVILENCAVTGNHCSAPTPGYTGQPGGGIQMAGGNLVVSGCSFSDNTSASSQGGAIALIAPNLVNNGSGGALTMFNSTFSKNGLTNTSGSGPDGGGAVYISGTTSAVHSFSGCSFLNNHVTGSPGATFGGAIYLNAGTLAIDHATFFGNSADGQGAQGGGLYIDSGTLNLKFSRFSQNVATNGGSGIYNHGSNAATTTATNNWWGCNDGPTVSGCDQLASDGGGLSFTPWITLGIGASPDSILINQSATLTASFLQNSAGEALTPANITALIGVPITFGNPVLGSVSPSISPIQLDGTATALFTAGTAAGTGQVEVSVDGELDTAAITINLPPPNSVSINSNASGPILQFVGSPLKTYVVQFAGAVNGPWTDFPNGSITAPQSGLITYQDTSAPPNSTRFYRVRAGP